MFLGLVNIVRDGENYPELCLIAEKPSPFSVPVPVMTLLPTTYAMQFLSTDEACTVEYDASDQSRIIAAVRPNRLFLTPDLNDRPGFSVEKVKITPQGPGQFHILFDRTRGWEPWNPNTGIF